MFAPFGYGLDIKSRKYWCHCSWLSYYNSATKYAIRIVRPYLLHEPGSNSVVRLRRADPVRSEPWQFTHGAAFTPFVFRVPRAKSAHLADSDFGAFEADFSKWYHGTVEPRPNSSFRQCPYIMPSPIALVAHPRCLIEGTEAFLHANSFWRALALH